MQDKQIHIGSFFRGLSWPGNQPTTCGRQYGPMDALQRMLPKAIKRKTGEQQWNDFSAVKQRKLSPVMVATSEWWRHVVLLCPFSLSKRAIRWRHDYVIPLPLLQPLLSLADSLLVQLTSRMEAWDDRFTRIGDIFMHMVRNFQDLLPGSTWLSVSRLFSHVSHVYVAMGWPCYHGYHARKC